MSSKVCKGGSVAADDILWRAVGVKVEGANQDFTPPDQRPPHQIQVQDEREPPEIDELRTKLEACQRHSEARAQDAYNKGLQQGEMNARQHLGTEQDAALQRLARTVEELTGLRQRCRCAAEQDVVKLALAIARRIVHRELTVDPSTILGLVKAAMQSMNMRGLHRIRIHPGQADALRKKLEAMGLPQRCEVLADPALEKGAVILESDHGNLDASAETQLEEIERGFADLVRHAT